MFLLDTSVVSEAVKPDGDAAVLAWLDAQPASTLFLPAVALAELLFGLSILPKGRKRAALEGALTGITELFEGRILPFDTDAAFAYVDMVTNGRSIPLPGDYIAAIAASKNLIVATRDTAFFEAGGLTIINPWEK